MMKDAFDLYLQQRLAQGLAESSIENYRNILKPFLRFLRRRGCRRIADVSPADLDAYMALLAAQGRAKSSRVQIAVLIRHVFRFLQDRGVIASYPARTLPIPDNGDADLPTAPLSVEEVDVLIRGLPRGTYVDLRNRCLVELLYACALRAGEAIALDLDAVDRKQGILVVRNGKGGQNRVLPLMPATIAVISDWLAVRSRLVKGPDTGAFFLNQYGRRLRSFVVEQFFLHLAKDIGRPIHAHLLRHSVAVHMLQNGADVREVQEFLGHARLDTTKVYLRLVPGRLKEAYEAAMPLINLGMSG